MTVVTASAQQTHLEALQNLLKCESAAPATGRCQAYALSGVRAAAFVGAGILALPHAFREGGLVASLCLLAACAAACNYCIRLLVAALERLRDDEDAERQPLVDARAARAPVATLSDVGFAAYGEQGPRAAVGCVHGRGPQPPVFAQGASGPTSSSSRRNWASARPVRGGAADPPVFPLWCMFRMCVRRCQLHLAQPARRVSLVRAASAASVAARTRAARAQPLDCGVGAAALPGARRDV